MKKQKKNNNQLNIKIVSSVALVAFVAAIIFSIVQFAQTINRVDGELVSRTPTAILASAGVSEKETIHLPVVYYDQRMDACVNLYDAALSDALFSRQFEWASCGYDNQEIEQGMVEYELNEQHEPVAVGGFLTSNRGVKADNFKRWFTAVDGKSASYPGTIPLTYQQEMAEFSFSKQDFYPLDEAKFSDGDLVNADGHNHLFTMNFAIPFTVLADGRESFVITADDDTFVFVGDRLVLDMGGIHDASTGRFEIRENGEVYATAIGTDLAYTGVTVKNGSSELIRIFHADRDAKNSEFDMKLSGINLTVVDTKLAGTKDDGIQVAYDPTDPAYVAPLGETAVFTPDNTRGYIIIATVFGILVVVLSLFLMMTVRVLVKRKK